MRDDRFKGLKDLKIDTNANTILQWVNEDQLKVEDLKSLLREIELAGQDQLGGEGKLEFNVDLRPLLYQIQLAHYRRQAEALIAKAGEPGVAKKEEVMLELIKTEAPKMIPPSPAPGDRPSNLETRPESGFRQRREKLTEEINALPEDSAERKLKTSELRIWEHPLIQQLGFELVAEMVVRALIKMPAWVRSRRAAGKVAGELVEEVGDEAVVALDAVRKKTRSAAQAATRTATHAAAELAA